ncbi:MAG: porin family protein [Deltaproteobacteria bacterium]
MRLRSLSIVAALVTAVSLTAPDLAWADARTKARRAFREGMRRIRAKDFDEGIRLLEEANRTLPHPNVQYNLAQAYLSADRPAGAVKWFKRYLDQSDPPPDAEQVEAQIAQLEARLTPVEPPPPIDVPPPGELRPLDVDATQDIERLESLADAMEPLSEERADEIRGISQRLQGALRGAPRRPDPPPPPPPPALPPPSVKIEPADELRPVEEYQEREVVTAATRAAAEPQDAPAVVWVITQQEIRTRGYESVPEALRAIAGLHVIDDHVFVDVGVRGIHGGLRGMSRLIKVLIDGHPVTFRPTNGTLLGLELIPIRAIDRIELIRGPGSALYGANAFLGVLQIITRRGADVGGGAVTGRLGFSTSSEALDGSSAPKTSGSLDLVVGTQQGRLSILAAAQLSALDRSGLRIPDTSPFRDELTALNGGLSENDTSRPLSLFTTVGYDLGRRGTFTLMGGWQRVDAAAEWLDYGALTHFSRVRLSNVWARLGYDVQLSAQTGLRAFTSYSQGRPIEGHQIRPFSAFAFRPDEARHFVESFESQAVLSGLEVRWELPTLSMGVRAGTDLDVDIEELTTTHQVFDEDVGEQNQAGSTIPLSTSAVEQRTFTNVGLYLQLLAKPLERLDVIGGLRYDFHSIYASALNGRLGAVLRATDNLYFKALYGSSYRAPAPDQLYRGSAYIGDARGCFDYDPCAAAGIRPQTAHTGELVAGYAKDGLRAQATAYLSFVDDYIFSFPIYANQSVTANGGTYVSRGVELEASAKLEKVVGDLDVSGHAYFLFQDTATEVEDSLFDPPESIRAEFRDESLFPALTAGGGIDFAYLPLKLGLYVEGRYVGPRRATGSNLVLSLGLSNYDGENLPGYFELDANLSTRDLYVFESGETVLSVRVTDVVGARHAEGGYRGWDIPTVGRRVFFRLIQEY